MSPSEDNDSDIAVIGGGLIGLAVARALAARAFVAVLQASGGNETASGDGGMLAPWSDLPCESEQLFFRTTGRLMFPEWIGGLQKEIGQEIETHDCGSLVVALEGEAPIRERLGPFASEIPHLRFLDREEARAEVPILSSEIVDAALLPFESAVDPSDLADALVQSCVDRGVEFVEETADEVVCEDGRAIAVGTFRGLWKAAAIVNAAGARARHFVERSIKSEIILPAWAQKLILAPPAGAPPLARVVRGNGIYLVPSRDGIVAGTMDTMEERSGVSEDVTAEILEKATRLAPALGEYRVAWARAGMYPDRAGGARLGRDRERAGLWHAIGAYRHEALLAPLAAHRISHQILG